VSTSAPEVTEGRLGSLLHQADELELIAQLLACPPGEDAIHAGRQAELLGNGSVDDVAVEFTRLFSAPPSVVSPYQSVYTDVLTMESGPSIDDGCGAAFPGGEFRGYLGGPSIADLNIWYREAGFKAPDGELSDHISVELAFMAHLMYAEAATIKRVDEEGAVAWAQLRVNFFERFLGRWLRVFAERLSAAAGDAGEYSGVAIKLRTIADQPSNSNKFVPSGEK